MKKKVLGKVIASFAAAALAVSSVPASALAQGNFENLGG